MAESEANVLLDHTTFTGAEQPGSPFSDHLSGPGGEWRDLDLPASQYSQYETFSVLEFLKNLWGLGTELE